MKICKFGVLALLGWAAAATPVAASPISYEYLTTALDGGPGAGISYTLVIDDTTGAASFTIDGATASSDVWWAGWFTFKFVGGSTASDITSFTPPPVGSGPWSVADVNQNTTVKVLQGGNYNQLLVASSTGFYVSSVAEPAPDDPTQGICLTTACSDDLPSTFLFTVALPAGWDRDVIPLQVGFYGPQNRQGKYTTNQLSRELEPGDNVPDTADTLAILTFSLVALGVTRRLLGA